MKRWIRRSLLVLLGLLVLAGLAYGFWPKPVPVDLVQVVRGPLRVTVDEDGQTRLRERYVISAPLAGHLRRIEVEAGDPAQGNETLLAIIDPPDPALLDPRARAEAQARVRAAEAALAQAQPNLERARTLLEEARTEHARLQDIATQGATSERELSRAAYLEQVRAQEYEAARFAQQIAQFQLELAQAALQRLGPSEENGPAPDNHLAVYAPCDGRVLRVFEESQRFVTPGTPLLEFGDPTDIEAVVDVLSTDAVRITPGDPALIERWGGGVPLHGRVRVVEPSGFTKVSALGVEEQRVNVIIDFADPPDARAGLGDGYRVEARIIIWEADDVLKVPTSALFRQDERWAVFRVQDGQAVVQPVEVGRQSGLEAQVMAGLDAGDRVVVHPSDQIASGVRVVAR